MLEVRRVYLRCCLTAAHQQSYLLTSQTSHMRRASNKSKRGAIGRSWQIQSAKAKFSEVFRLARTEGPQHITRQGKEGVVMISDEQYDKLVVRSRQPKS